MSISAGLSPQTRSFKLLRLHSLAFGFGTFAYAKDRASLPHDGLLQESPTPMPSRHIRVENKTGVFVPAAVEDAGVCADQKKWRSRFPERRCFNTSVC